MRRWVVARNRSIYHYDAFDPISKSLLNLNVYEPADQSWSLKSQTFAAKAQYQNGQWTAQKVWQQNFGAKKDGYTAAAQRTLALEAPDYFETAAPHADMMTVPELTPGRELPLMAAAG